MLLAVRDPGGQMPIGVRIGADPDVRRPEVRVGARRVLLVIAFERERETALELRGAIGHPGR